MAEPERTPLRICSLDQWADAVQAMVDRSAALSTRVIVVPNARVAYMLRRTLVQRGQTRALMGTRFLNSRALAEELLRSCETLLPVNALDVTPSLVRRAIDEVELERFHPDDLLELPGWDEAIARTVDELEHACVDAEVLLRSGDPIVRDVGRMFARVQGCDARVGPASLFARAAQQLTRHPRQEPTLVVLTGFESAAEAALLRALPRCTWGIWLPRPLSAEQRSRLVGLFGFTAPELPVEATNIGASALATLQAGLFRSATPASGIEDESVALALCAGVHEEVESAVGWVIEQVVSHGRRLDDLAILSPNIDDYAPLLRARLHALPWPEGAAPCHVERGIALSDRADGQRILHVLRALREGLPRERLAPLLPLLRESVGADSAKSQRVRGQSSAWMILNEVACLGGVRGHLEGGLGWAEAWNQAVLRASQMDASNTEDEYRPSFTARLAAYGQPIVALTALLERVVAGEGLKPLWGVVRDFAASHVRLPIASPPALAVLDGLVERQPEDVLHGVDALDFLTDTLAQATVQEGRFGAPAIYLGSLRGARGLRFKDVRIVGLCEGSVPSAAREDAVLSDARRASLSPWLDTADTRVARQLAAFADAICTASQSLTLSAPRVGFEGSTRQPASVLLEVVRLLAPNADDVERALEQQFERTRERERETRLTFPVSVPDQLTRVAMGDVNAAEQDVTPVVGLAALRERARPGLPSGSDGLVGGLIVDEQLPGLTQERPISATRLATLLSCPHRFLLEQVLGMNEPTGPTDAHTLDALSFGSLLHEIAERFWGAHGHAFGERTHDLEHHTRAALDFLDQVFAVLTQGRAFASAAAANAQRHALANQLVKLLEYDWNGGKPRRFVATEQAFGFDAPLALETEAGPLFLRGRIDRLDVEGNTTFVRDLKTGKGKPRKEGAAPDLSIDLQLGVYARVVRTLHRAWGVPDTVLVSYVYLRAGEIERRFEGTDYQALDRTTEDWLATAHDVLSKRAFVRSPDPNDCVYCMFKPVCESQHDRTQQVLSDRRVPKRLRLLKPTEAP